MALVTPGAVLSAAAAASKSAIPPARSASTVTWPVKPRILLRSSVRKPFITAMTMMSVATPSAMPTKEKPAITEMKPSLRRARR
jgi:hypothetical protein